MNIFFLRSDISLCISNLKRMFKVCVQLWISGGPETVRASGCTLRTLIEECIGKATSVTYHTSVLNLFNLVTQCLSYQYKSACPQVLHTISVFFKVCIIFITLYYFVFNFTYTVYLLFYHFYLHVLIF